MEAPKINWEPLRKYGPSEVECRCGAVFRSLAKGTIVSGDFITVTETKCPGCGENAGNAIRVSTEPELWTLRA